MDKVLVTGGTGYIGSHTVIELLARGREVLVVDNLSNSGLEALDQIERVVGRRPEFLQLDLLEAEALDALLAEHRPGAVIHFAAFKAVGESMALPLKYYRNNLFGMVNLTESCLRHGVRHFVFSSSCTVYAQPDHLPVGEDAPVRRPTSPYGNTKRVSEEILEDALKAQPGMKAIALRYFNPIGAHPSGHIGELPLGVPNNLVPYMTQAAIGLRGPLSIFGQDYPTPDGTCVRDYIHVVDLALAHLAALERLEGGLQEQDIDYINVGNGVGHSVREVIETFARVNQVEVPHRYAPRRPGDVAAVFADNAKAERLLGWKPRYRLEDMLRTSWLWEKQYREKNDV